MTDLTAREAAARLVLPALRLDADTDAEVRRDAERALEVGVGGFVLFGGEAGQVRRLTGHLRRTAGRPLWMASDLERGAGQQFRGAVACPPPAALARAPEPGEAARSAGRITGLEARRVGVDWVFAPVLDLDVEPENPIVSTRSFGADPERVARLGSAWIDGCQSAGVAACAKHYPGHGRTTADSHVKLPVVDVSAEKLARGDLVPFRAAAPRVASVMTAHVAYPALDPGGDGTPPPAGTYSRAIVERLLREEMGFAGMVVTDALVMGGAGEEGLGTGALAARALRAGCDVMLYPEDLEDAVEGIADRVGRGGEGGAPALGDRVRSALDRVRDVRERFTGGAGAADGAGAAGAPDDAAGPPEERAREALRLAASCVTAAGPGDAGAGAGPGPGAGLDPERPVELAPVTDDLERAGEPPASGDAFARELESLGWRIGGPEAGQRVVLLRSTPQAGKGRAAPAEEGLREARRLLDGAGASALVVFGHERALRAVGRPGLCAWSAEDVMQRAAARELDAAARAG